MKALIFGSLFVFFLGLWALTAFPLKWLWNFLMPYLFHLPTINYWHALGIMVLVGMIFGGIKSSVKSK